MDLDREKQTAARHSMRFIDDGNIVGLGTGSTAEYAVRFLAERLQNGLKIKGIPTSERTARLGAELGIPLATLDQYQKIDVAIDGCDEADPQLRLIKGAGGAFLREKIIASAAKKFVIIADSSKQVQILGKTPLPVEVVPFAQTLVAKEIEALGATAKLREDSRGKLYVTDEGHHIFDCHFGPIADPAALGRQLEAIPGVVEHGLFIGMADIVLIGQGETVVELRADKQKS
jgi:ribose 5-phosphate isomerase A